eukprot:Awhi_evm1s11837
MNNSGGLISYTILLILLTYGEYRINFRKLFGNSQKGAHNYKHLLRLAIYIDCVAFTLIYLEECFSNHLNSCNIAVFWFIGDLLWMCKDCLRYVYVVPGNRAFYLINYQYHEQLGWFLGAGSILGIARTLLFFVRQDPNIIDRPSSYISIGSVLISFPQKNNEASNTSSENPISRSSYTTRKNDHVYNKLLQRELIRIIVSSLGIIVTLILSLIDIFSEKDIPRVNNIVFPWALLVLYISSRSIANPREKLDTKLQLQSNTKKSFQKPASDHDNVTTSNNNILELGNTHTYTPEEYFNSVDVVLYPISTPLAAEIANDRSITNIF